MPRGRRDFSAAEDHLRLKKTGEGLASTEDFGLSGDDVHIWRVWLDHSPGQVDLLAAKLSRDEHARADRFHFAKDRTRFIISRGILRTLLGQYLALSPNNLAFTHNQYGKPSLGDGINQIGLQFNLSHSHELVLYAFTRDQPIGIDLEYHRYLSDLQEMAARCFSRAELEKWERLPPTKQQETFFLYWTQKEAFLKATGYGLHKPLTSIEVAIKETDFGAHTVITGHTSQGKRKWSAISFVPARGYIASLVTPKSHSKLTFREYGNQ